MGDRLLLYELNNIHKTNIWEISENRVKKNTRGNKKKKTNVDYER